jgi:Nucleolar pre-ribosomal-associated protein 1
MVNVLPNRLSFVYNIVVNYLSVREKFDFNSVPELLVLFHSTDVQQEEHRMFLLNVILNGIKDDLDFKLLNNTPVFKIIFSCYGCPLSDRKIDLMVLRIIDRMVTKTSKIEFLMQRYGLALWIFQVASKVEAFEYDAIEMILSLIEHSLDAIRRETKGDIVGCKRLLASLLTLLPKFTKARLTGAGFSSFLKSVNVIAQFSHINQEHRDLIVDLVKIFLPENLVQQHVTYLDVHPEAVLFAETKEKLSKSLDIDDTTKTILLEARQFVMNCHKK